MVLCSFSPRSHLHTYMPPHTHTHLFLQENLILWSRLVDWTGLELTVIPVTPLPKSWDMGVLGTEGCKNQHIFRQHDTDTDIWMNQLKKADIEHLEDYESA